MLAGELKRPMDKSALGNDVAALNNLCAFLNSPLMATTQEGEGAAPLSAPPIPEGPTNLAAALHSTLPVESPSPAPASPVKQGAVARPLPLPVVAPTTIDIRHAFYTGRICSGKDYVAGLTGAHIEGFARPLYSLATFFFGVPMDNLTNKDLPGMREFLQRAGQWGRGLVDAQHPYTTERAIFITAVRSLAASGLLEKSLGVDWEQFGRNENIWLDAALSRVAAETGRVAITNVRFGNEFKKLTEVGYSNWHVMTTPKEWQARLAARKIEPNDPVLKDTSEQLAASLDTQVVKTISKQKNGAKLRVIWNSDTPPPSPRLWTVAEFLKSANS
jgi:hypothetical protein